MFWPGFNAGGVLARIVAHTGVCVVACLPIPVVATPPAAVTGGHVAIIIDDMGNSLVRGRKAISISQPLTYSFLPNTAHARTLASDAYGAGKEVMVHLPMESNSPRAMGTGVLTRSQNKQIFLTTLNHALSEVPHAVGINNHMGSALTQEVEPMTWLMSALKDRGLFFIDSRTTPRTVALVVAQRQAISAASRDVFLDNERSLEYIDRAFSQLLHIARTRGTAIGIAHPHPETLAYLDSHLHQLNELRLVPVSRVIELRAASSNSADRSHMPVGTPGLAGLTSERNGLGEIQRTFIDRATGDDAADPAVDPLLLVQ